MICLLLCVNIFLRLIIEDVSKYFFETFIFDGFEKKNYLLKIIVEEKYDADSTPKKKDPEK